MTWRFLDTGTGDVSVGYNQDMNGQIDPGACEVHGITRVRRFTGGRTVLHGWDITYSVTAAIDDIAPGEEVSGAYAKISHALVRGLEILGARAEFARPGHRDPAGAGKTVKPCFTSVSRFEVNCRGRKIVGSAQRVMGKALLQHGSMPLVNPPVGPHMFVPGISDQERERLGEELRQRSTCLSVELGREIPYDEVREAMVAGFEGVFGIGIRIGDLSRLEREKIADFESKKYGCPAWNRTETGGLR
jgi:lipoate-protein ligase A